MTDVYQSIALNLFGEDLVKAFVNNSIKVSGSVGSVNVGSFENGLDGTSFHVNIIVELLKDSILTISSLKEDAAFVDDTMYSTDIKKKFPVKVPLLSVFSSKNVSIDNVDATSFPFCKKGDKGEWIFSEIPSGSRTISISYTYVDVVSVLGTQRISTFGDAFPAEYLNTPGFYIQDTYKTASIKIGDDATFESGGFTADGLGITGTLPGGNRGGSETYTITAGLGKVIHNDTVSKAVSAKVAKLNKKDYYNVSYAKNGNSVNDKDALTGDASIISTSVPVSEEGMVNLDWSIQTRGEVMNVTGTPRQGNVRWSKAVTLTASTRSVDCSREVKTWWGLFSGWHYRTESWTEYYYRGDSPVTARNSEASGDFDLGSRYLDPFITNAEYAHSICTVTPLPLILLLTKPTGDSQSLKNFNEGRSTYIDSEKLHLDGMDNVAFQRVVVIQSAVEGVTVSGTIRDDTKQYTVSDLGIQMLSNESTYAEVNLNVSYYGHSLCTISHTYSLKDTSSVDIDLLQSVASNILDIPHCVQGKVNVIKEDGQKQLVADYYVIKGTDARYSLTEEILLEKGSSVSKIGTSQILTAEEISILDAVNGYYECNVAAIEASIAKVKDAIDIKCNYECSCATGYYTKLNDSSTKINWTFKSLVNNNGYLSVGEKSFISNSEGAENTSPDSFSPMEASNTYWCQVYTCRFTSASEDEAYTFFYHKKVGMSFNTDKGFSFTEDLAPNMTDADKAYLAELSKLKCNLKVNGEVESSIYTEAVIKQDYDAKDQLLIAFTAQDIQLGRQKTDGSYVLSATQVNVSSLKEEVIKRGYLLTNPTKTETDFNTLSDPDKQSIFESLSELDMRGILDDIMICSNNYSRGYITDIFKWSGLGDIDDSSTIKALVEGEEVKVYQDNSAKIVKGKVCKRSSVEISDTMQNTEYSIDSLPAELQAIISGSSLHNIVNESETTYVNEDNKNAQGDVYNTLAGHKLQLIASNKGQATVEVKVKLVNYSEEIEGEVSVYNRVGSNTYFVNNEGDLNTLKNLVGKFVSGNKLLLDISNAIDHPNAYGLVTNTNLKEVHTKAEGPSRSYEFVKHKRQEVNPVTTDFYISSESSEKELVSKLMYSTKLNLYAKIEPLKKSNNNRMELTATNLSAIQDQIKDTTGTDVSSLIDILSKNGQWQEGSDYSGCNVLEVYNTDKPNNINMEMVVGSYEYLTLSLDSKSTSHVGKEGVTISLESNLEGLNNLNLIGTKTGSKANVLF